VKGIDKVDVNIVGRYCVIKHCPLDCCAPPLQIVEILNKKRLGASIQEVAEQSIDTEDDGVSVYMQFHACVVSLLFVLGLSLAYINGAEEASKWCYISGVILGILPILKGAGIALLRQSLDINMLMIIALVGALAVGEYFDGSLLVALILIAELVEEYILASVRRAIKQTSTALPKQAFLANGQSKNVEALQVDDVIAVRAGEMILGDGVIMKGEGVVDESAVTGEAMPLTKVVGARALSGTVMQNGYLEVFFFPF
jgi:Cd2+/Zn2+-exporting ATPase